MNNESKQATAKGLTEQLQRAHLLEAFKRYDHAETAYRELTCDHPEDFRAYFNLAQLLGKKLGDVAHEEAACLFRKVITIKPGVIEAYAALAAVLIKLNRPAEAVRYCNLGLELDASNSQTLYNLNVALRQIDQLELAVQHSWHAVHRFIDRKDVLPTMANTQLPPISPFCKKPNLIVPNCLDDEDYSDLQIRNLTIVCVKWGTKYGPEYVNNLYRAITRRFDRHNGTSAYLSPCMICFTDDASGIDAGITCLPFDERVQSAGWRDWWLKAQVFSATAASHASSSIVRVTGEAVSTTTTTSTSSTTATTTTDAGLDSNRRVDARERAPADIKGECLQTSAVESSTTELLNGWMLYIDLDTIICDSIDFIYSFLERIYQEKNKDTEGKKHSAKRSTTLETNLHNRNSSTSLRCAEKVEDSNVIVEESYSQYSLCSLKQSIAVLSAQPFANEGTVTKHTYTLFIPVLHPIPC